MSNRRTLITQVVSEVKHTSGVREGTKTHGFNKNNFFAWCVQWESVKEKVAIAEWDKRVNDATVERRTEGNDLRLAAKGIPETIG